MSNSEPITGGCLCRAVRFELSRAPSDPHYCHCRTCQKASGGPVVACGIIARRDFRFTSGAPKIYASSDIAERGFCCDCGTYLIYRPTLGEWSNWMVVSLAAFDEPDRFPPARHYGVEDRFLWFETTDAFPRDAYEENFTNIMSDKDHPARAAILTRYGV